MNVLSLILLTTAAGTLQAIVPTAPWLGEARVPLLLALALHYALTRAPGFALGAAILSGVVQDALGRAPLGGSALLFGAVALIAGRYRDEVFHAAAPARAVFGALAAAATTLGLWAILGVAGLARASAGVGALRVASAALLGAAATPLVGHWAARADLALGLAEPRAGPEIEMAGVRRKGGAHG